MTDGVNALCSVFSYLESLKGAIEGPFTSFCPLDGPQKEHFIMFLHHVPDCEKI